VDERCLAFEICAIFLEFFFGLRRLGREEQAKAIDQSLRLRLRSGLRQSGCRFAVGV
jgi:hypothetical protein